MFINMQPNVMFRQDYSFATCSGRTQHPCSYFIFAIKTLQYYYFCLTEKHAISHQSSTGVMVRFNV